MTLSLTLPEHRSAMELAAAEYERCLALLRTLDAGGRPLREIRVAGDLDLEFAPEPSLGDLDLPLLS